MNASIASINFSNLNLCCSTFLFRFVGHKSKVVFQDSTSAGKVRQLTPVVELSFMMDLSLSETNIGSEYDEMPSTIVAPREAGETDPTDDGGRGYALFVSFPEDAVTLAKLSLGIIAQTLAIILVSPIPKFTSSAKILAFLAAGLAVAAYVFCICAILLSKSKPLVSGSMGVTGLIMAGLSFLSIMASILPHTLRLVLVLPYLVLLSVFVSSFIKK